MHPQGGTGRDLAWLLNDLSDRVPDFQKAVILSRDGLVVAASSDLSREEDLEWRPPTAAEAPCSSSRQRRP